MTTGIQAIDSAERKAVEWTRDLAREIPTSDLNQAWSALRAAMHALRDRLLPDEAMDLAAQLPTILRGMFFEGWDSRKSPTGDRTAADFLTRVGEVLVTARGLDPDRTVRAVFRLLARRVSQGEIEDVVHMLPAAIQEFWPTVPEIPSGEAPGIIREGTLDIEADPAPEPPRRAKTPRARRVPPNHPRKQAPKRS